VLENNWRILHYKLSFFCFEEVTEAMAEIRDFHHPYTPYDIQETFMRTVYQTLEDSKIGILESPTGTV
jgi:hypothetical protein